MRAAMAQSPGRAGLFPLKRISRLLAKGFWKEEPREFSQIRVNINQGFAVIREDWRAVPISSLRV
jgi:hypothetical protein